MCGKRFTILLLVCLLLCSPVYSEDCIKLLDEITTELETVTDLLQEQMSLNENQRNWIKEASKRLSEQDARLQKAESSLQKTKIQRNVAISFSVGLGVLIIVVTR